MNRPPIVLSIAGSDPSGGAGIQADLKTFSALGSYGCAVLTSLTAQNTRGVTGIHPVPADFVTEQIVTLFDDLAVQATKVGMLANASIARALATCIESTITGPVVLDPVMVSTSGSRLVDDDALDAIRGLLPLITVVTPNLHEAAVLLGRSPAADVAEMVDQAQALRRLGAPRVLVKGGHHTGPEAIDVWCDEDGPIPLSAPWVNTANTHGTGCTLSAAIAALYPHHQDWLSSVRQAKTWLTGALEAGADLDIGHGNGPVHHFYALWSDS
ncbi:MAG: bifunctional hydroxymethylpyrimidine kinase/phosphomethylpyrimidine kinase [Ornithinimicrobium sp.]